MINSTATYTLAGNMTASGTCIIINSGGSGSTLDCGGSKITGPSSNNGYTGIYLNRVNSVTVTGCKVTKFGNGIKLASSNSSSVLGNYLFQEYGNGIAVTSSRSNIISDNNATSNAVGIYLEKSSLNSVSGNNCSSNDLGFSILDSTDNNVTNNIANFNTGRGMLLHGSSPHNNLTGNAACGNHQENIYCNQFQVDGGSNTCTQTGCNVTCGTCP